MIARLSVGHRRRTENQKDSKMGRVNMTLLPVKLFNYFFFGSVVCVLPIVPTYMGMLGLSPNQIAIIYGTMPFVGFLSRPITGKLYVEEIDNAAYRF